LELLFSKEYHNYYKLPVYSPLESAFRAGSLVLPSILKFHQIAKKTNTEVEAIPLQLPSDFPMCHSILVCPVTKGMCTAENPPIMLKCGHVISREAVSTMFKGRIHAKIKCPYCPIESTLQQLLTLHI
jgi:hypothetical protein